MGEDIAMNNKPLIVDLDGTLIRTDILFESFFGLLKRNIFYIFLVPFWLLRGKAELKREIANRVDIDVSVLPYHQEFLHYLKGQQQSKRTLVLATASDIKYAQQVADYLGIFDEVFASDGVTNLSSSRKLEKLQAHYGDSGFDYAGNSSADFAVWQGAENAIVVNASTSVAAKAETLTQVSSTFKDDHFSVKTYLKALRVHQWVKNILIFVPLLLAHRFTDSYLFGNAALAFIAFSCCASSVYLLNDLLDLENDRHHPRKRKRPFAAGDIPLSKGLILTPVLLAIAIVIATFLPWYFAVVLAAYYVVTLAYSFKLKQVVMIDMLILAGLYTVRIIAGAAATLIEPSFWLLAFSVFVFTSLAMVKRYTELLAVKSVEGNQPRGRGYVVEDIPLISALGAASGYISVLVLALYIQSGTVVSLYQTPILIWILCPIMLYWVSRVWMQAHRGQMHDDPVVFAIKDPASIICGLLMAIIVMFAI